jgi:serine/threonine-protein kinase
MTDISTRIRAALEGRYTIDREIGRGGMATVYLAQDVKHDRQVALKVLHPELGAILGAERFLTEIKVTANLQHPHILPLHDSGEADGLLFYVMPYVEGETLRQRLEREHEMAVDAAVELTRQIASALDYAHRHDVIHRDIKPENILLHDGQAVVADFGIALAVRNAGGSRLTETGLSLGTPQYMSPEQAMADRELDARSDVYSLGCVAYEMLAGEAPHSGPNAQAILTKIVTEDAPPITDKRRSVPPGIAGAIHHAIQKLPADRFASAQEFADALARPTEEWPSGTFSYPGVGQDAPATSRTSLVVAVVVSILAIAAAVWALLSRPDPPAVPITRSITTFPASQQFGIAPLNLIAVAPDGSGFVYVGTGPNGRMLYHRRFDNFRARLLRGTENGGQPTYSPDGRRLAFSSPEGIKILDLSDGNVTTIGPRAGGQSGWTDDDHIVFERYGTRGLQEVPVAGGEPVTLTVPDSSRGEVRHNFPYAVAGTKDVLFTVWTETGPRVAVLSRETGSYEYLIEGFHPVFSESEHILFGTVDTLWAVGYDRESRTIKGPRRVLEADVGLEPYSVRDFGISSTGTLVYIREGSFERQLVEVDREGREHLLIPDTRSFGTPRYDPTGQRISVIVQDGDFNVWLFDVRRRSLQRLTFEGDNYYPAWSPDGRSLVYSADQDEDGTNDLVRRRADGTGGVVPVYGTEQAQWDMEFAPDGRTAIFRQNDSITGRDLWLLDLPSGEATPFLVTRHQERAPKISPDGSLLAYVSDESGTSQVYLRTFPDTSGKWLVTAEGGTEPVWAPSGRELFYRSADQVVAVSIDPGPPLIIGTHVVLLEGPYVPNPMHANYDIHPDGDRFVMLRSGEGERSVVVVTNLFAELGEGQ